MKIPRHVVGVGASAGGIPALCALLAQFKHDAAAFVVVMHLPPDRISKLTEVLARCTHMDVRTAYDGETLAANSIYVAPESYDVILTAPSRLGLVMPREVRPRATIDHFFRSLCRTPWSKFGWGNSFWRECGWHGRARRDSKRGRNGICPGPGERGVSPDATQCWHACAPCRISE